jgi:hypothetical protein
LSCFSGEWIDFDEYKIPAEFEIETKRNPEVFKRDYMALPSLALEPYFKRWDLIERCIDKGLECPIDEKGKFKSWFRGKYNGKRKIWYFLHVDLSLKRDATGIAMSHHEGNMVIVDFMLRIKPPVGGEIQFSDIRDMILELRERDFYLVKVTYDGWQSVDSLQILRINYINCETLSVDKDTCAYDTLKERISEGTLNC